MTPEQIWSVCKKRHYSAALTGYWQDHTICEACRGKPSSTPHHIRTRGSGGDDSPVNLAALCVECHGMVHAMGVRVFVKRYPHMEKKIAGALSRPKVRNT